MTSAQTRQCTLLTGAATIALILTVAGCAGSAGTTQTPGGGGGDDAVTLYAGIWEGTFDISIGSGGLSLVLNHDEGVWTGEVLFGIEGEMVGGAIESFAASEEGCTFQVFIEMADVFMKARIEDGVMIGSVEAYADGQLVADGTFVLNKK